MESWRRSNVPRRWWSLRNHSFHLYSLRYHSCRFVGSIYFFILLVLTIFPILQNTATMPTSAAVSASGKRYTCPYCPYGTDRRDLYTRHENIHREEKPFHCYICYKPFNRADHVKKHFLRMHREHGYELSRIRRPAGSSAPKPMQPETGTGTTGNANGNGQQQQQQHANYSSGFNNNKGYQLQPNPGNGTTPATGGIYQATSMPAPSIMQPEATNCATGRRVQNGGCNSKSHLKGGSKGAQERRWANIVYTL